MEAAQTPEPGVRPGEAAADAGFSEPPPGADRVGASSPAAADESGNDVFAERPELFVGAAFAGGLAVAGLLRWLGR